MTLTVDAVYEGGLLKPKQALMLPEGSEVRLTVNPLRPSLAERIVSRARALPPETVDAMPVDLATQHDHYLYGTPKRPE